MTAPNKQISIASMVDSFPREGALNVYVDTTEGLHTQHGHPVGVMALNNSIDKDGSRQYIEDNPKLGQLTDAGISVVTLVRHDDGKTGLPVYSPYDLGRIDRFLQGRDIITTLGARPLGPLAEVNDHRPAIVNLYHPAEAKSAEELAALRQGLASGVVRRVIVDSDASHASYVTPEKGFSPGDITVIHNGIDINRFKPSPENRGRVRHELKIPDDAPVVLLVGRDDPVKDIELFMKSAREYLEKEPEGRVVMAGAGLNFENPNIADLANAHIGAEGSELRKRFLAIGARNDLEAVYNAGDVLALTSKSESRPLCISEAQASGLGVAVSTDVGDAPSMIGKHGFISDRDPEHIAILWQEAYDKRDTIGFPIEQRDSLGTSSMVSKYHALVHEVAA